LPANRYTRTSGCSQCEWDPREEWEEDKDGEEGLYTSRSPTPTRGNAGKRASTRRAPSRVPSRPRPVLTPAPGTGPDPLAEMLAGHPLRTGTDPAGGTIGGTDSGTAAGSAGARPAAGPSSAPSRLWRDDEDEPSQDEDQRWPPEGAFGRPIPQMRFAGDWDCPRCGYLVFAKRRECPCCADKSNWEHPEDWTCLHCRYTAFGSKVVCPRCDTAKGYSEPPEGSSRGLRRSQAAFYQLTKAPRERVVGTLVGVVVQKGEEVAGAVSNPNLRLVIPPTFII
jgi:hypothetical protein